MTVRTVRPGLVIVVTYVTPCDIPNPPMSPCVGMYALMQADVILNHFHTIYKEKARTDAPL